MHTNGSGFGFGFGSGFGFGLGTRFAEPAHIPILTAP
jgi:hypothetical protein